MCQFFSVRKSHTEKLGLPEFFKQFRSASIFRDITNNVSNFSPDF